jgi:flagellar biosynthesis protein FlhF
LKVKKFVAPSMPEAMKMVRNELGSDAVILNSKEIQTGGILGFFRKRAIEVIAASDPNPSAEPQLKHKRRKDPIMETDYKSNDSFSAILKEIKELKAQLNNRSLSNESSFSLPAPMEKVQRLLKEQEVNEYVTNEIMYSVLQEWFTRDVNKDRPNAFSYVKDVMIEKFRSIPFGGMDYKKKYITFVGPTGVGKTTTLAKVAANSVLKDHKKVAFITTDTYRIAAVEQLKTYAKILGIPLEVCYTIEDFRLAKEKFSHYDIVFIDTSGRNYTNKKYVEDLHQLIDFNNEMETYLVLSLTSKFADLEKIYHQFSLIKIDKFIFTKADETSTYGSMVNLIFKHHIGAAYVTNGQNVPDDIVEATPEIIVNTLFGVE